MGNFDFTDRIAGPLQSTRLTLRRPLLDDVPAMVTLANNKSIHEKLARLPYPYMPLNGVDFVVNLARTAKEHAFAILDLRGHFIGVIGFHLREPAVELGYWIGEPHWGHGYASEAVAALVGAADAVGCKRIVARALSSNKGSLRVLEKSGFSLMEQRVDNCGPHSAKPITYLEREVK